jgi:putative sigma-54 modulation protein
MRIELRSTTIDLTAEIRDALTRRARFALDRFGDRIHRVTVWLADENGPKGGLANTCTVSIELFGAENVFVKETHEDALHAGQRAIERAGKSVARAFGKRLDRTSLRYVSI